VDKSATFVFVETQDAEVGGVPVVKADDGFLSGGGVVRVDGSPINILLVLLSISKERHYAFGVEVDGIGVCDPGEGRSGKCHLNFIFKIIT